MRAAQARALIGARMRELRVSGGLSLSRVAELSGWTKSHLSRVESGATKPSLPLIEWYDRQFGAADALVRQFHTLTDSVRLDRERTLRDSRLAPRPELVFAAGGSVPADHDERDECLLVAETVPDGSRLRPDETVRKTWTLRNAGATAWLDRWLTRQGSPGVPGWVRCVPRIPVPPTVPGADVIIAVEMTMPRYTGACVAYFKLTDAAGRPYFPDTHIRPLHASFYVTD